MDMMVQVQVLDKAVCISQVSNTLGKGMTTNTLSSAMGK